MANSKVVLTFNSNPSVDERVAFYDVLTGATLVMSETFKNSRSQIGEASISPTIDQTMFSYILAFNIDYNNTNLYLVYADYNLKTVTIESTNINSDFVETLDPGLTSIDIDITNEDPPAPFTMGDITISEATTTPCDKVKLTINTSDQADSISSPVSQPVGANPFIIDVDRKKNINVSMIKGGVTVSKTLYIPKLLSSYFKANIVSTPTYGAVSISNTFELTPLFTLEYSLDNILWKSSNYFNNLGVGSYTCYIRDNIGCSTSIDFEITSFTPNLVDYDGICEISNLNPIRYKEDVVWDDSNPKTPSNTLSFEEDVTGPNKYYTQPFEQKDTISTQIKTNYSTISAKTIDVDGNETALTVTKMTANMNITDIRDGYIVSAEYNDRDYVSIKYSGGKVYDSVTQAEIADYNIGENVPSWMNKDDYVNIEGVGWYKVLEVIYSVDAYVLVINLLATDYPLTLNSTQKITSIYNAVDYENYECPIDFLSYDGYYKVEISISDNAFGTKSYTSEWLNIKESHGKQFVIEAYNSENNEINFSTGFSIKLRVPRIVDLEWSPNTEQDIYVTDTNTVPLENKYRGFWKFISSILPTVMAEKLLLILLQDRLKINGVTYETEGSPESKRLNSQYQIIANLVKSDYVFNSNENKGVGLITIEGTALAINSEGGLLLVE